VYAGGSDFGGDLNRLAQQNIQAEAISLLSQGVSFIHAGSEILRSKPPGNGQFDHNSYQSPYSVNSLKWNEKVTNLDVFEKYQELIALKRDIAGFQYTTRTDIDANVSVKFGTEIGYANNLIKLVVIDGDDTYTAYFFGAGARLRVDDLEGHMVVFDSSSSYENGAFFGRSVILKSNMTLVTKSGPNVIPPTSEDPGTTSEPITPDNGEDANLIWLYITLPTLAVIGIGTLLFFFLRKKQISPK
jgi:hypothetical protein